MVQEVFCPFPGHGEYNRTVYNNLLKANGKCVFHGKLESQRCIFFAPVATKFWRNTWFLWRFSGYEKMQLRFFSNYRLCVECSSLARSALHSSYMRHSTAQLAIKSQKRNSINLLIFTLENRKTAQCTPNDPTKLICVTPSEWIGWYRRYDNLKHSLFECVREKMLTL